MRQRFGAEWKRWNVWNVEKSCEKITDNLRSSMVHHTGGVVRYRGRSIDSRTQSGWSRTTTPECNRGLSVRSSQLTALLACHWSTWKLTSALHRALWRWPGLRVVYKLRTWSLFQVDFPRKSVVLTNVFCVACVGDYELAPCCDHAPWQECFRILIETEHNWVFLS